MESGGRNVVSVYVWAAFAVMQCAKIGFQSSFPPILVALKQPVRYDAPPITGSDDY